MILKDLNQIAIQAQNVFQNYKKEEVALDSGFKSRYSELYHSNEKISFAQYTTVVETSSNLTITFPNQWFYIASYFVEFLVALKEYKSFYNTIFQGVQNTKEIIKSIKDTGVVPDEIKVKVSSTFTDSDDVDLFNRFLSDYSWWYGSKTIDRGDYFVSPILSLAKVVNVTQSYIADLAYRLAEHPDLLDLLQKSKLSIVKPKESVKVETDFSIQNLIDDINDSGLLFDSILIKRFISSLLTKPFVILSGLSGSGKTKLAQAFVQWICQDESQYCIVPVGADWTNREPLLGYPNALKTDEYIKPDNGALDVIINANNHPELPHFLILDEMNLSHVERYFADFLSVMESKGEISLFAEGTVNNGVPSKLILPSNLFIIGTVNIDETTYMFSPKVLDRANAIEFRVTKGEIETFFANQQDVDMDKLKTRGTSMAQSFLELAEYKKFNNQDLSETHKTLVNFFEQLKKTGAEFGYRSATEIIRLINQLTIIDSSLSPNEKLDIAIMQKLLPKLHGSRRKLCPVLVTLGGFCVQEDLIKDLVKDVFEKEEFDFETEVVKYPLSLEKIIRMYKGAFENGFASYAEA
ncbi:hypothetical protein OU798_10125 [Prolixibacteraceae bacterium Z1-6]|uniref:DUF3578 domain-containing protein n=1 Tax=Draconibacterium aestuarii TaxID=2998507 RepID=A0A9X3F8F6_9BACT|nr:hypothetical protein [Prolixibacteraceae bacterium Z1-6]